MVEQLAHDLQAELPGVQGLSASSLWYMRRFYLAYRAKPKLQPLVEEIGWSHNLVILERCNDDQQRGQFPGPDQIAMLLEGLEDESG